VTEGIMDGCQAFLNRSIYKISILPSRFARKGLHNYPIWFVSSFLSSQKSPNGAFFPRDELLKLRELFEVKDGGRLVFVYCGISRAWEDLAFFPAQKIPNYLNDRDTMLTRRTTNLSN